MTPAGQRRGGRRGMKGISAVGSRWTATVTYWASAVILPALHPCLGRLCAFCAACLLRNLLKLLLNFHAGALR